MFRRVLIMGAAGRDFHNFNRFFRDTIDYLVVAFTATQIPGIESRTYPKELAGPRYPEGIPIYPERQLVELIKTLKVDVVVFAYSDVPYEYVMQKASMVQAAGASFMLLGPNDTMIKSNKPVISVCAVRTGCGKSQTTRRVAGILKDHGLRVVFIRHPMPYDQDLNKQRVQRFASYRDFKLHNCTIEEREEYERVIEAGFVLFAGVDYETILREAEKEADIILWDGGNNDFPFYESDLEIVVVDPHRPGHELKYWPGSVNFLRADILIINKMDTAKRENVGIIMENAQMFNPQASVISAKSIISIVNSVDINGKRVLAIEDGPTATHGEASHGAAWWFANQNGLKLADPKTFAKGSIAETFKKYPDISGVLPAMGYSDQQIEDLVATINATPCDVVVSGTPIDLVRLIGDKINKPILQLRYELEEFELEQKLLMFIKKHNLTKKV